MAMTCQERNIIASWNYWNKDDVSLQRLLACICDDCECELDEVIEVLHKYGHLV